MLSSIPTLANSNLEKSTPILKPINSTHPLNIDLPITRAEFIIAVLKGYSQEESLPPIMDTHYALPAMHKAESLGLIDLEKYPMNTWSEIITQEEKIEILTKAMQNSEMNMEKVYATLNEILIKDVTLNGNPIPLNHLKITHYNGKVLLPLRLVAEAMGFEVAWNQETYTATLNNGKIKSTVQVGFDSYNYSSVNQIGMSAPFSTGAAPRLIDGSVYVAAEYFEMFAGLQTSDHTIHFTLH